MVTIPPLTRREKEVLAALAGTGGSNKALADRLGITWRTVASHLWHINRKTGTSNRTELVTWALRHHDDLDLHADHPHG